MPTLPLTRLRARRSSQVVLPVAYTVAVSGAEESDCSVATRQTAELVGQALALRRQTVIVGMLSGVSAIVAASAKSQGGQVIGFSTAISAKEQARTDYVSHELYDLIVYAGTDYDGRNQLMLRSCQAIIFVAGHAASLPEITLPLEDEKVIGVLTGPQTTSDEIAQIVAVVKRSNSGIIYESDPVVLVDRIITAIQQRQVAGKQ